MQTTISLGASAAYGHGGKQYIARITGRDPKFTFARDFVGRKCGKRSESAEYDTDEPGLYVECDIDKHGDKDETYRVVYDLPGCGLTTTKVSKEEMMALAKKLDKGGPAIDWTREALSLRLSWSESKDPDGMVKLPCDQLGLTAGEVKRSDYVTAIKRALNGESTTTSNTKGDAVARVMALMDELGVTIEDLSSTPAAQEVGA